MRAPLVSHYIHIRISTLFFKPHNLLRPVLVRRKIDCIVFLRKSFWNKVHQVNHTKVCHIGIVQSLIYNTVVLDITLNGLLKVVTWYKVTIHVIDEINLKSRKKTLELTDYILSNQTGHGLNQVYDPTSCGTSYFSTASLPSCRLLCNCEQYIFQTVLL